MKNWFNRLMAGRNGTDNLCRFLSFTAIFFLVISMFTARLPIGSAALVFALVCLFWCWFRALSKNTYSRSQENAVYLRLRDKLFGKFKGVSSRMKQRKEYRFFRCPSCKTWLRVPRGKGKVNITCRHCGNHFTKKT